MYNTPPPLPPVSTYYHAGGELNQPKWVGPARGGWEQVL